MPEWAPIFLQPRYSMPTRKIEDVATGTTAIPALCLHPDHKPPMHQVFEPGTYEHECPNCGQKTIFTVNRPVW